MLNVPHLISPPSFPYPSVPLRFFHSTPLYDAGWNSAFVSDRPFRFDLAKRLRVAGPQTPLRATSQRWLRGRNGSGCDASWRGRFSRLTLLRTNSQSLFGLPIAPQAWTFV